MGDVVVGFTSQEAERLSGLSSRRLQYWDETNFIRPSISARQGRGVPRLYTFQDLVQLRVAAILRNQLSLQALRRLKLYLDVGAPFASVRFGLLSGDDVVYLGPAGQIEAAKSPGQVVVTFDVPLREIKADLESRIRRARQRHGVGRFQRRRGIIANQETFAGTRIPSSSVERMLDAGWAAKRILNEYPDLRPADIAAVRQRRKAG